MIHGSGEGGGVYKKRLGKNLYRSIVLARGNSGWLFTYLFAKQDRANIQRDDLLEFRRFAVVFSRKTESEIEEDLRTGVFVEICHGK